MKFKYFILKPFFYKIFTYVWESVYLYNGLHRKDFIGGNLTMKLTRLTKSIIAVACSIAMVVAGLVFSPAKDAKAAEPDWSTISYLGDGAGGGKYTDKYKFYAENGTTAINIQHPGFATEDSIYVGFPAADIQCSLAGYDVQGAGACLHLSNFTNKVTQFTVSWAGGSTTCYVYYADGAEGPTTTVDPSAPTTTTEEPTTEAAHWINVAGSSDYQYWSETDTQVVSYQNPGWSGQKESGIYVLQPTGQGAPVKVVIDGVETNVAQGDNDTFYCQGAGLLFYDSTLVKPEVDIEVYYAPATTTKHELKFKNVNSPMVDVTEYKATGTYPTEAGKVFAGFFEDAAYTTAYTASTGYAFAKFIDEKVLTVQFQTANDGSAVRFVSTIDNCLDYQQVGFKFTGTYGNAAITEKTKTVNSVFEKISGGGQEYIPSTAFDNDDSAYFFTYTVRGMTDAATASTWNVTPFFVTPDGTTVEGTANTYPVS